MKATETKLLQFLKRSSQFVIPIYQRAYSWSEKECDQLWHDIIRAGGNDKISAHFVGSIVYVEDGIFNVTNQPSLLVIDGQQRLTTIMLILEALARAVGEAEVVDGFSAVKIRNYYLQDSLQTGDKKYKLILSEADKDSLKAIIDHKEKPNDYSIRIDANFEYFTEQIKEHKNDLAAVCNGLSKLIVVDISLSRDQDNPQLIFESLNSTGKELSQADLIRNYILMGLDHELQSNLYANYWRRMEKDFGQEGYALHFDSFMRHYLTVKTGDIPREREVYEAFKQYSKSAGVTSEESLVADIYEYAKYFCAMALNAETDAELKIIFNDIRELKVDVAFPMLLELYDDYKNGSLKKEELLKISRLIESYVFRRAVCGIPTNSMNKTFANFVRDINKSKYLESVEINFSLLPSYRRFPSDEEFMRDLKVKDLYNFRSRSYWLRRLENHGRKENVQVTEYTIEHVMPQNENLSPEWQKELGEDWMRIHSIYLHSLGNLTLTGYNSEYSDRPFAKKKTMKNYGFVDSPLRLNRDIARAERWNEQAILSRADSLALQASSVWLSPKVDKSILESFKSKKAKPVSGEYTLADHPHLRSKELLPVFEEFRKQVLAIDPCVNEEFLKLYVAYKAESNFVDAVPQAKRLRLSLNMPYSEINDPKGISKDVTNLGRWGNGDVEIGLSRLDEIPYVMSLVRQSFDRQIDQSLSE